MNAIHKHILFFGLIGFLLSCDNSPSGYKYEQGKLPDIPVNLVDFNTEYDDFNSTAPSLGELIPFCFSTNRGSAGAEFDIIFQPMNVNFDKTTGVLKITNEYANWAIYEEEFEVIKVGLNKIKTTGNEYGPNLLIEHGSNELQFTLFYSTDITGSSQINYITNKDHIDFSEPREIKILNSKFDEMYPTFNSDKSRLYFCSNRDGESFNIHYVDIGSESNIESLLSNGAPFGIYTETSLSSTSDDKCPFIFGNMMVFASNRDGGHGGFDLYYSLLVNNEWSEPVNFGSKINSEYDDYRPILVNEGVSDTQTMMIFSSNRPGGLGGFDLYFVGIENK